MRLTAGKVSFSTNPCSPANPVPHRSRVTPYLGVVDLSPGRAGHCDTGSAFVPPIASLIAAATADRSVLAIGHDFEVIPVMAFLRGRSHGRARGRRVVVLCRSHGSQRGKGIVGS